MDENLRNICLYGTYYNPADNHYGRKCDVICDRCFRHNLDISIGWQKLDLCLKCVQIINDQLKQPERETVKPAEIKTYMLQNQFLGEERVTKMRQLFYTKGN
uniref:Uncharacterized protein n=1 Tax=viral metagenome TaxID=1070528 RepID=A0A6C0C8Z7_9ZZZZ